MAELIDKNQLENELTNLSNKWSINDKFLICKYTFKNFNDALSSVSYTNMTLPTIYSV